MVVAMNLRAAVQHTGDQQHVAVLNGGDIDVHHVWRSVYRRL